jgi:hypothetical protein
MVWQRMAHNPEVAGSNPAPATGKGPGNGAFLFFVRVIRGETFAQLLPSQHDLLSGKGRLGRMRHLENRMAIAKGSSYGAVAGPENLRRPPPRPGF